VDYRSLMRLEQATASDATGVLLTLKPGADADVVREPVTALPGSPPGQVWRPGQPVHDQRRGSRVPGLQPLLPPRTSASPRWSIGSW
jgi:hypothetical protein